LEDGGDKETDSDPRRELAEAIRKRYRVAERSGKNAKTSD
jgi:hypothetical protein